VVLYAGVAWRNSRRWSAVCRRLTRGCSGLVPRLRLVTRLFWCLSASARSTREQSHRHGTRSTSRPIARSR